MLLYSDIVTDSEMFSDAYKFTVVDDIVYQVDTAMITIKKGTDVDIGANPSAEDQEETLEEGTEQVNNLIHTYELKATSFDKKSYIAYLKEYMKLVKGKLKETNPDRVDSFEKGAAAYAQKIIAKFKDYEFYTGKTPFSGEGEGMVTLLNYREDGVTPYFTFWKDGLKEVKL